VLVADQLTRRMKRIPSSILIPLTYLFSLFLWIICSLTYLLNVPSEWWEFRDDSVIHLSAARNFSLFGSIGLSAGDRVESLSSPLNFFIALVSYLINPGIPYETYLKSFLLISLAAVAFSVNYSILRCSHVRDKFFISVIISNLIVFLIAISSWTTFGWLISGMENVLLVALTATLIGAVAGNTVNYFLALFAVSLLGVARVELAALLIPLLLLISIRTEITKKQRITLFCVPIVFWATIHFSRFLYFGHLFPNTATALGKNLPIYLALFLILEFSIVSLTFFESLRKRFLNYRFITPGMLLLAFAGLMRILTSNFTYTYQAILIFSLIGILVSLQLLVIDVSDDIRRKLFLIVLMIPLNHFFLFGPARLSAFRIVSAFVIPILIIAVIFLYDYFKRYFKTSLRLVMLIPLAVAFLFAINIVDHQRNLCCAISPSDDYIRTHAAKVFGSNSGIAPIPIVANPDLGKISFYKNLMNVDLGLIGEPVLARISRNTPELVDDYLIDYMAPDILELHGHWNCVYSSIINNVNFEKEWQIVWSGYVSEEMNPTDSSGCPRNGQYTIWERGMPEKERSMSAMIATEPFSVFSKRLKSEISICSATNSGCQYLTRAIIRNKALLLNKGELSKTVKLLAQSPSYQYDYFRILQPRNWDKEATSSLLYLMKSEAKN